MEKAGSRLQIRLINLKEDKTGNDTYTVHLYADQARTRHFLSCDFTFGFHVSSLFYGLITGTQVKINDRCDSSISQIKQGLNTPFETPLKETLSSPNIPIL